MERLPAAEAPNVMLHCLKPQKEMMESFTGGMACESGRIDERLQRKNQSFLTDFLELMAGFEPATSSLPTDKILAAQGFSQLSLYRLYENTTTKIRQMRHTNGCCYTAFNRWRRVLCAL